MRPRNSFCWFVIKLADTLILTHMKLPSQPPFKSIWNFSVHFRRRPYFRSFLCRMDTGPADFATEAVHFYSIHTNGHCEMICRVSEWGQYIWIWGLIYSVYIRSDTYNNCRYWDYLNTNICLSANDQRRGFPQKDLQNAFFGLNCLVAEASAAAVRTRGRHSSFTAFACRAQLRVGWSTRGAKIALEEQPESISK